jgi:hypothetical protein
MIQLIEGRGQLGKKLQEIIERENITSPLDIKIYHTWDISDKSKETQSRCFDEFKKFVDENPSSKIIFTSTYSQTDNFYNLFKQKAEAYLLNNNEKGYVIRLPTIIGKGVCEKFRDNELEAYGKMELITLEDASLEIIKLIRSEPIVKSFRVEGTIIPAKIVKELILFGTRK